MKIHEYQGKEILRQFGVTVPRGIAAFTVQEAVEAAQKLGGPVWVVKAQIHAGGRGKGGGVKLGRSIEEVKALATEILGMQLVTHQTGPEGQKVRRLLIEEGADIKKEYYVSVVTDRDTQKVAIIASSEGGMDIEEVAHSTPEKILKDFVDPALGLTTAQATQLANGIGVPAGSTAAAVDTLQKLYKCYMDTDASLVEVNPLILEGNGGIKALDAKFNFDANALFRHPEITAYRDLDEEDPAEVEASKFDLAYISLDGNIGCLVNGAGLAMATMDTIKLFGAEPANFLDVGGGATPEKVTEAFKIMLKNPKVEAILVNIFGGIMKCDTIATGIITACKATNLNVPLVVRMKGTNEELGKKMLAESGLPIISADSMAEAAEKVVAAVKKPEAAVAAVATAAVVAPVAAHGTNETHGAAKAAAKPAYAPDRKSGIPWWLWLVVAAIALLLWRSCGTQSKESHPAPAASVASAAVVAAPAPMLVPALGTWTAKAANAKSGEWVLEGLITDQATKDGILAAAKTVFGDGKVLDKLTLDDKLANVSQAKWADLFGWLKANPKAVMTVAGEKASFSGQSAAVDASLLSDWLGSGVIIEKQLQELALLASKDANICTEAAAAVDVTFVTGSGRLAPASMAVLKEQAEKLKACPDRKLEVAGHTDNVGKPEANLALSQQRADAVTAALSKLGVAAERISAKGYGDTKPAASNDDAAGRALNRRVEFIAQ
jgi:succinyl-CoA synthetase beta subunit